MAKLIVAIKTPFNERDENVPAPGPPRVGVRALLLRAHVLPASAGPCAGWPQHGGVLHSLLPTSERKEGEQRETEDVR